VSILRSLLGLEPDRQQRDAALRRYVHALLREVRCQEERNLGHLRGHQPLLAPALERAWQAVGFDPHAFLSAAARELTSTLLACRLEAESGLSPGRTVNLAAGESVPRDSYTRWLQQEVRRLRSSLEASRLADLQQQVDQLRAELAQAHERLAQKEEALARTQAAHQSEVAQLQATIADLNRIVAQQQEQLNACLE